MSGITEQGAQATHDLIDRAEQEERQAHPEQHTGDSFSQTHAVGVESQQPQQGSQEQPKGKDNKIKEVDKLKEKLHMK